MVFPSGSFFVGLYLLSFVLVMGMEDWFSVWVGLEINMMVFIILVFSRKNLLSVESSLKYFFVQSLGSALFVGTFYFGSMYLEEMVSFILSLSLGVGPMYFWFPSVCEGLSWVGCLLLMTFQKLLPLLVMMQFFSWMIGLIVVVSLLMGMFGSFNQVNFSLLLAYSSIHHVGWLMMLMGEMYVWVFYLLFYGVVLLSVVWWLSEVEVEDLMMVSKRKDIWWMVVGVLSMAGMPPLLGFFLKWFAFFFIVSMSMYIIGFMVMVSVVMFYVYFRLVYFILLDCKFDSWVNSFSSNYFPMDFLSVFGFVLGYFMLMYMY